MSGHAGRRAGGLLRGMLAAVVLVVLLRGGAAFAEPDIPETPPFILPFAGEPGPNSWLLIQPYGNTTFAYRYRNNVYYGGQGLHFGIDIAAPCGTPIRAIGDGEVFSVDSWHGAGPHNLMINHPNGFASFYGHLLTRSSLRPGDKVKAGDVIAYSGDPDLTCTARPHLHLEIRNAPDHNRAYNPILLIDADWDRIAMIGGFPFLFERDLGDPRRWQTFEDQPETHFGYPLINDYAEAWPLVW